MRWFIKWLGAAAAASTRGLAIAAIDIYRAIAAPLMVANLGPACRFEPSCSSYAREAIVEFGVWRGGWMALRRVLRCRPAGGWGYDPVRRRMSDADSDVSGRE